MTQSYVKTSGSTWYSFGATKHAKAIMRFRLQHPIYTNPYYSYKGLNGVMVIKLITGHRSYLDAHDIVLRISTMTSTDLTPDITITDADYDSLRKKIKYKITVDTDGWAYLYVMPVSTYESVAYQVAYSECPQDIDDLAGNDGYTMTAAEYEAAEGYEPANANNTTCAKQSGDDNSEFIGRASGTGERYIKTRQVSGDVVRLIGDVVVNTDRTVTDAKSIITLPMSVSRATIWADVYHGRYSEMATSQDEETITAKIERLPFRVTGNKVYACTPITGPAVISFDCSLYLSNAVANY